MIHNRYAVRVAMPLTGRCECPTCERHRGESRTLLRFLLAVALTAAAILGLLLGCASPAHGQVPPSCKSIVYVPVSNCSTVFVDWAHPYWFRVYPADRDWSVLPFPPDARQLPVKWWHLHEAFGEGVDRRVENYIPNCDAENYFAPKCTSLFENRFHCTLALDNALELTYYTDYLLTGVRPTNTCPPPPPPPPLLVDGFEGGLERWTR